MNPRPYYKNLYLPSILHLYHHLFAELVHLYNLPLYWVCWGHKRLFVIWLQGHPLEGNLLLSYKPLHLQAQQRLQEEGCVVDIKLFSGAVAGEGSAFGEWNLGLVRGIFTPPRRAKSCSSTY
ncbi:hypothetical protein T12_4130 [Trichinella patagoniensis]|uniref:Uncharacterized protein n=1 Tax=Trichinella patagoniensis TaxID=990121 RepID=A0A0V0YZ60_9BILA|nr:hypothetical protein T12_4130 [Trichinella patagoniensis]